MKRSIAKGRLVTVDIRARIHGCWQGKAVGGTLGQACEGLGGPLDYDFYFPVPTEMVPNDDLDLQVLYGVVLSEMDTPRVDRHVLAQAWADHVAFPWNEYGVGMRNLAEGIAPPFTGSFDNWFTCGEGAAIRSELWACLAAGNPDLAGAYCYEDACFDHAGDGIWAAVFLARLQALAFVESDPQKLIAGALDVVPADSELRHAITSTQEWVGTGLGWREIRALIMATYGREDDFTDVRHNTAFVILGWLAGRDFSERICITNNCGEDTDSSTASLGALLGILDPTSIDARWLAPIGDDLVLNAEVSGITCPPTINGFTDLVVDLRERLGGAPPPSQDDTFDAGAHGLDVDVAHFNTTRGDWLTRDISELPAVGGPLPTRGVTYEPARLPGTWVRWPREDFRDRLLLVRYAVSGHDVEEVRLMLNSSEDFRVWLDGSYLFGGQGTGMFFPSPHSAPVGQFHDFHLDAGEHTLTIAIRRPLTERTAEWVIGLAERPSMLWIPYAFRPDARVSSRQPALARTTH